MGRYEGWTNERLIERIKDLESRIHSNGEVSTTSTESLVKGSRSTPKAKKVKTNSSARPFDFSRYKQRFVAFKFAYLGWHYNGLVTQDMPTELPTVEEEIFNALLKIRLIEHPDKCNFSRCGRTDKGVSAMGQVMALNVRSNQLKEDAANEPFRELPWMEQLNGILPPSIRILAYDDCIPPDFDARFSCLRRHYKYLITPRIPGAQAIDFDAMNTACSYFLGEHDFRNFCKLDASKQITNFKRSILRCEISRLQLPETPYMPTDSSGLYVLDLEGSAFLWHQVRCITAILLLIGQGQERPELVKQMLDISQTPTKPLYEFADDWPLTLYDCDFGDQVNWKYPPNSQRILENAFATFHSARVQDTVASFMVHASLAGVQDEVIKSGINLGDGRLKVQARYTAIMERKRMEDVAVTNAAYAAKKARKKAEKEAKSV